MTASIHLNPLHWSEWALRLSEWDTVEYEEGMRTLSDRPIHVRVKSRPYGEMRTVATVHVPLDTPQEEVDRVCAGVLDIVRLRYEL